MTVGSGKLVKVGAGQLRGIVGIQDRGPYAVAMDTPIRRDGIWYATLTIESAECEVMRIPRTPPDIITEFPNGEVEHWHGVITIDGYSYRVRIEPGESWDITMHDRKQPIKHEFLMDD